MGGTKSSYECGDILAASGAEAEGRPAAARCRGLSSPHPRTRSVLQPYAEYCEGGRSIRIKFPNSDTQKGGGVRGANRGFTPGVRHRCLHSVNAIDQRAVSGDRCVFTTLTYPLAFPSARETKIHFKEFLRRFRASWGACGHWKLEPQKRGAPHYHLLAHLPSHFSLYDLQQWTSRVWYDIVKSGDEKHLLAGTQVKPVESWAQVCAYAGKAEYLGKLFSLADLPSDVLDKWQKPGKFWGIFGAKDLPVYRVHVDLSRRQASLLRRAVVRYYEHQRTPMVHLFPKPGVPRTSSSSKRLVLPADFFTGRSRDDPQSRDTLAALRAEYERAYLIVPIMRRWRRSSGGISCFMRSEDFERLLGWSLEESRG